MRKKFNGFQEFNDFVNSNFVFSKEKEFLAISESLIAMCLFLQESAKEKFGHYQPGWDELSDTTKQDRVKKGYSENDPLYRDGTTRDSVEFEVNGTNAFVGSKSDIMLWNEKGTSRTGWSSQGIPPRPVFLTTQVMNGKEAVEVFFQNYIKFLRK